jgi:methyl-accepting chemotaxis protein
VKNFNGNIKGLINPLLISTTLCPHLRAVNLKSFKMKQNTTRLNDTVAERAAMRMEEKAIGIKESKKLKKTPIKPSEVFANGFDKSSAATDKTSAGANKTSAATDKTSAGANKTSAPTDKTSAGANKTSAPTNETSAAANKSSDAAEEP